MKARLQEATASGTTTVEHLTFDHISVSMLVPFGRQDGLSLGLQGEGTRLEQRYDASGTLLATSESPFSLTFAMRQATGSRWMNVAVLPPE
jgi:hypothetical protein